jgi:putative hydrolase of the HAD superfamily
MFDCFGVVCDPVLFSWYNEKSVKHGFTDEKLFDTFREFDLGILSEDDIVDYFMKYKGITSTKEEIRNEIDGYLKIDENLVRIIKKLKEKGYKTALLSNGNHSFFERKVYKEYPDFKNLFDKIIISSAVKMVKPNTEIFFHALKETNCQPHESLFIDDNKQNVAAAISLGMNGFVYTDSSSFADYIASMGITLDN